MLFGRVQEASDDCHCFLTESCRVLGVAVVEERRVRNRAVMICRLVPFGKQAQRLVHLLGVADSARLCNSAGFLRTIAVVEQAEHEIIGVLVLVPVLEGQDLENGVRQDVATRTVTRDLPPSSRRSASMSTSM
jgi:hypothetical protein